MDLVVLVLILALIGWLVYLITTKIKMPPYWATTIQIFALAAIVIYLISRFVHLPNVLTR
jgi:hypothetical protein